MQAFFDLIARWFCSCGARRGHPTIAPLPLSQPPLPQTAGSSESDSSVTSPSSQLTHVTIDGSPAHATPHHATNTSGFARPKPPPPRPPPSSSSSTCYGGASSSSQPNNPCPACIKAPPPCVFQFHNSAVERNRGLHWASFAFLTFEQYMDGWTTHYTDDYSRVFFHNAALRESRWTPPPIPVPPPMPEEQDDEQDTEDSTGGS